METKKFIETMNVVLSGVAKKDIAETMGQIVFDDGYLISYNDKIAVSSEIDISVDNCGVSAYDLSKALKGIRTKEFDMHVENDFLIIEGGKIRVELPTMIAEEMKHFHNTINIDGAFTKMRKTPSNFITGLTMCKPSVSYNMSSSFGGYAMKFTSEEIQATDGYRLSVFEFSKKIKTKNPFFISKEIIDNIIDFSPTKIYVGKSWVYFTNSEENTIFACRKAIDNVEYFPNVRTFLKKGIDKRIKFNIKGSESSSLEMLSFFTDGDKDADKEMKMIVKENKVIFSGDSIKGTAKVELESDYSGEKKIYSVSAIFIKDIITMLNNLEMEVSDKNIYIHSENFQHLINLIED